MGADDISLLRYSESCKAVAAEYIERATRFNVREHVDYAPSQVVSEYFALVFQSDGDGSKLDGIVYPSAVRPGGRNLVLFPTARRWVREFSSVAFSTAHEISLHTWRDVVEKLT